MFFSPVPRNQGVTSEMASSFKIKGDSKQRCANISICRLPIVSCSVNIYSSEILSCCNVNAMVNWALKIKVCLASDSGCSRYKQMC